jgi:hypothetical protein
VHVPLEASVGASSAGEDLVGLEAELGDEFNILRAGSAFLRADPS